MRKILCFCLVVIFIMGTTINVSATDTNVRASGECGENLIWTFYRDGTFVVSGTGKMTDYEIEEERPWDKYVDNIEILKIEEGVTSIGSLSFIGARYVRIIYFPESLRTIDPNAFSSASFVVLEHLYFGGTKEQYRTIKYGGYCGAIRYDFNYDRPYNRVTEFHFNESTLFKRVPRFYDQYDLGVSIKTLDKPAVVVVSVMKGKKTLSTLTKNIDDYDDPNGAYRDFTIPQEFLDQATEVKVYLWDSLDTMKPLDNPKTAIMYEGRK